MASANSLDSMLMNFPRAAQASINTEGFWQETFAEHDMPFPPSELFLRAYKSEKQLEVWASNGAEYQLVKTYEICMVPGKLGPKIRQGDKQVPEGIYFIDSLNPNSDFHLSLRVNYPNQVDAVRSAAEKDPGGDIYIHGDCYSVGCLPMQDEPIEEIFWLVTSFKHQYPEKKVNVHIFPFKLQSETGEKHTANHPEWQEFWSELKKVEAFFDSNLTLPHIEQTLDGKYQIVY